MLPHQITISAIPTPVPPARFRWKRFKVQHIPAQLLSTFQHSSYITLVYWWPHASKLPFLCLGRKLLKLLARKSCAPLARWVTASMEQYHVRATVKTAWCRHRSLLPNYFPFLLPLLGWAKSVETVKIILCGHKRFGPGLRTRLGNPESQNFLTS